MSIFMVNLGFRDRQLTFHDLDLNLHTTLTLKEESSFMKYAAFQWKTKLMLYFTLNLDRKRQMVPS